MMHRPVTAFALLAAVAAAHAQTFSVLPAPLPGDLNPFSLESVSADGTSVVGDSQLIPPGRIYHSLRWLVGTGTDDPSPVEGPSLDSVTDISADGSVMVGYRARSGFTHYDAWVRTPTDASVLTLPEGYTDASAPLLSADGRIASFAIFTPGDPTRPSMPVAYDIAAHEFTLLGMLPDATSGVPYAIDADGSTVVGTCVVASRSRAFRWTASSGMQDLGVAPGGMYSLALAVSGDGSTVFGLTDTGGGDSMVSRWTQDAGFVPIARGERIDDVSPDGQVLIGSFEAGQVWDEAHGFRTMEAVLQSAGLGNTIQGWNIYGVYAVNQGPNGYAFAGTAFNDTGSAWWVATVPSMDGDCPNFLAQPPESISAEPGDQVAIAATVGGADPLDLQWFRNEMPLSDDERIGGTRSSTLTIADATTDDTGVYFLRATNECGTVQSDSSSLSVMTPPPPCIPDFNHDGSVNSQDFFDFLSAFFNNDPVADINADSAINSQDFFDFMAAYFVGC